MEIGVGLRGASAEDRGIEAWGVVDVVDMAVGWDGADEDDRP